jgi:hypothetical protein
MIIIIIISHLGTAMLVFLIWVHPSAPNGCRFHLHITMLVCIFVFGFVHAYWYFAFGHIHSYYNLEFGTLLRFFITPLDHVIMKYNFYARDGTLYTWRWHKHTIVIFFRFDISRFSIRDRSKLQSISLCWYQLRDSESVYSDTSTTLCFCE